MLCVLAAAGIAVADTKAMGGMGGNTLQTRTVGLQADIGTPIYMSPEQLKKGAVAGNQSDLWSTGTYDHLSISTHHDATTYYDSYHSILRSSRNSH